MGWRLGNAAVLDEICHILDLWLVSVVVSKECQSGERVGKVWGSSHCGLDLVFEVALTVECETEIRLGEI